MKIGKFIAAISAVVALIGCSKQDIASLEKQSLTTIQSDETKKVAPPVPGKTNEEITFKGIPFDKPGQVAVLAALCTPESNEYPDDGYIKGCPTEKRMTSKYFTFSVPFGLLTYSRPYFTMGQDGSLLTVSFSVGLTEQMFGMIEALTQKYGPPLLETTEVQNGFGQKFEKIVATWTDSRGTRIKVVTRDTKINLGSLNIDAPSAIAAYEAKVKAAKEVVSKNL